jgi:site-specific DNA recombinase
LKSKPHEGWKFIGTGNGDGGHSGGSTERPALLRLLDDVRARRIDVVVVYNVDRLTRVRRLRQARCLVPTFCGAD